MSEIIKHAATEAAANPVIAKAISASTIVTGLAAYFETIQGWLSIISIVAGIALSITVLRVQSKIGKLTKMQIEKLEREMKSVKNDKDYS